MGFTSRLRPETVSILYHNGKTQKQIAYELKVSRSTINRKMVIKDVK